MAESTVIDCELELSAPRETVALSDVLQNAKRIEVLGFEYEGVPLVAGVPETPRFLFGPDDSNYVLNPPLRIGNTAGAKRGVSLPLQAAAGGMEFFHPKVLATNTQGRVQQMEVRVCKADGYTDAVFTRLLVRLRVYNNRPLEDSRVFYQNANTAQLYASAWHTPADV